MSLRAATRFSIPLLLAYSILSMWIEGRLPWATFQMAVYILGTCWAASIALGRTKFAPHWSLVPLSIATCWGFVQFAMGTTVYIDATVNQTLTWIAYWVLFAIGLQICDSSAAKEHLLAGLLWFVAALSIVATVQNFTSDGRIFWLFPSGYSDLVMGPFVYQNQYAAFIELILPIALFLALKRPAHSSFYFLLSSILYASVISCASRAGAILATAEVIAILVIGGYRGFLSGRRVFWTVGIFVLMTVAAVFVVGWDLLFLRLRLSDPYLIRGDLMRSSLDMIKARPALGFGLGTWPTIYPQYAYFDNGLYVNQAHNDWIQWAAEGGLPFCTTMLVFTAFLVKPAIRSIWGLGLLFFLAHCFVDYPMQQRPAVGAWFFFIAGVLLSPPNVGMRHLRR